MTRVEALTEEKVVFLRKLEVLFGVGGAARIIGIKYSTAWTACRRGWRHV